MDDNSKHASSYQLDQEILDERGIDMTVEEVAGLPTCKYSERVQSLKLNAGDLAFLKGLRRRIKNRLASQNSRRRSVEHLRRLARELRAVRACRDDALADRRTLLARRTAIADKCVALRRYLVQILQDRSDSSEVPSIVIESQVSGRMVTETKPPPLTDCYADKMEEKQIFECRIDKLVQQSVNHIFKMDDKKKVFAKTVFISNELSSNVKSMVLSEQVGLKGILDGDGVLNLSVKEEGRKRGHGRKQSAPRRITYAFVDDEDGVLDLKIKKENQ